jgi:hypothetical protein
VQACSGGRDDAARSRAADTTGTDEGGCAAFVPPEAGADAGAGDDGGSVDGSTDDGTAVEASTDDGGDAAAGDDASTGDDAGDAGVGDDAGDAGVGDDAGDASAGDDAGDDAGDGSTGDDAAEASAGDDAGDASTGDDAADASTGDDATAGDDGSTADAGADVGVDATTDAGDDGGALGPCTTPNQTGCVPCSGNASGVCTPTEARFVQHDIAGGLATLDAGATASSCYACLVQAGCVDDTQFGDTGHECGDLSATFDAGAQSGTPDTTLCLGTIDCILQSSCATSDVASCYCGPANTGSACVTATANGACVQPEVDGLGFPAGDNADVLKNFTDTTKPSGMANQIFLCAATNGCTTCLQ